MRAAALAAAAATVLGCATPAPRQAAAPQTTAWDFSDPAAPLRASTGPATLSVWGDFILRSGPASSFGLPPVAGRDKTVLAVPALGAKEGLALEHHAPPNGVFGRQGRVSNYTLVFDLLWTSSSARGYHSLYQADPANSDDAELFLRDPDGGLGVSGLYHGRLEPGSWHRVAVAVQCALGEGGTGQLHKFLDGVFLGGQRTPGETRCHWTLGPRLQLFADEDGETAPWFLSGLSFSDRFIGMDELAALGGPSPGGPATPGPAPAAAPERAPRRVAVIAHRGASCCAPENTLAALHAAAAAGADAAEVDVRLSADGVAFLMHDPGLERTTDGRGTAGDRSMRALRKLDAGSWFDLRWAGERVPSLAEALAAVKGRLRLLLDVKSEGMGAAVAAALKEAGVGTDAIRVFRNKDDKAAADFARHLPGVGVIWGDMVRADDDAAFAALRRAGVVGFDLDLSSVTAEFARSAQTRGFTVTAYTALDPDTMRRAAALGLDGLETDFPAVLDALLPPR